MQTFYSVSENLAEANYMRENFYIYVRFKPYHIHPPD